MNDEIFYNYIYSYIRTGPKHYYYYYVITDESRPTNTTTVSTRPGPDPDQTRPDQTTSRAWLSS
jgi:hypothetical protein